jgi:hypothetical protein
MRRTAACAPSPLREGCSGVRGATGFLAPGGVAPDTVARLRRRLTGLPRFAPPLLAARYSRHTPGGKQQSSPFAPTMIAEVQAAG